MLSGSLLTTEEGPKEEDISQKPEEPKEEGQNLENTSENTFQDSDDEDEKQKTRVGVPKDGKIPVHMYGILRGQYKCPICGKANDYFNSSHAKKFFKYKHIDFLSPKGRKVAEKEGFDQMPMIKYLPKGETKWQWVQGFDEEFWEGLTEN